MIETKKLDKVFRPKNKRMWATKRIIEIISMKSELTRVCLQNSVNRLSCTLPVEWPFDAPERRIPRKFLVMLEAHLKYFAFPELDHTIDRFVRFRQAFSPAVLGVPRLATQRPGQLPMKRVGQVEQRPGQDHDVVAVQDEADRDRAISDACTGKGMKQKLESVLIKFFASFFGFQIKSFSACQMTRKLVTIIVPMVACRISNCLVFLCGFLCGFLCDFLLRYFCGISIVETLSLFFQFLLFSFRSLYSLTGEITGNDWKSLEITKNYQSKL